MPLNSPFPTVWLSAHDATDLEAGVHCELVFAPWMRRAARIVEDLLGL